MCLGKYLKYVSIKGMVQKFQIRQLIATRHIGMYNKATALYYTFSIFDISAITGRGLDLLQVHGAHSVVSDADKHSATWAKCKRSGLIKRDRENCLTLLLNLRPTYYF